MSPGGAAWATFRLFQHGIRVEEVEVGTYRCKVMRGTGSATGYLSPMLDAWAASQGLTLEPGTFNLCADRFVMVAHGQPHESLAAFGGHAPRSRQGQEGFSPRLYRVTLDGTVRAWLYRWSEPGALRSFVGPQDGCPHPARFCEVVAGVRLRDELGVEDGDTVTLAFGWDLG